jgi:hypothetical protein
LCAVYSLLAYSGVPEEEEVNNTETPYGATAINPHTGAACIYQGYWRERLPTYHETMVAVLESFIDPNHLGNMRDEKERYPWNHYVVSIAPRAPRHGFTKTQRKEYFQECRLLSFEYGILHNLRHNLFTHSGHCPSCGKEWKSIIGEPITCFCGTRVLMHLVGDISFIDNGPGRPSDHMKDVLSGVADGNDGPVDKVNPRDLGTVGSWSEALGAASDLFQSNLVSRLAIVGREEYLGRSSAERARFDLDESGNEFLVSLLDSKVGYEDPQYHYRLIYEWIPMQGGEPAGQLTIVALLEHENIPSI